MKTATDVTQLLLAWSGGDSRALEQLLPLVYRELRRIAGRYLKRERPNHTLQPTALVHEAYLKLTDQRRVHWQNRAHFYGIAAQAMRRILVDHARLHQAEKRGGALQITLDENLEVAAPRETDLLALDDALQTLAQLDPQKSRIVELRYFGGLSIEETAEVLGIGTATVIRQWRLARAWLFGEINRG